jgi:hypothetical protein
MGESIARTHLHNIYIWDNPLNGELARVTNQQLRGKIPKVAGAGARMVNLHSS